MRAVSPKIYSRELIEIIFEQPYCRIADLVAGGVAKRQAASKYLYLLGDIGILWDISLQDREKLFVNARYRELLSSENNTFKPFQRP